ncbi:MAG: 30S ribosome-binding factor RbfA [Planctomycetota bacterium]|jgi:ribosome-binding factor A
MGGPKPFRKEKLEREIVRETSQIILYEMKDPRLGFVTVTRAKISDDYRYAKVFISVLGEEGKKRLTMQGLEHARGFVQRSLSRRIPMRTFPELAFVLDESVEKTMQMVQMIDDLTREREEREGAEDPEAEGEHGG